MDKSKKSQVLKLSLIASLLVVTPLIPTSLRSTYLYFLFNLLIIALGAEAGFLSSSFSSSSSNAPEDHKKPQSHVTIAPKPLVPSESAASATGESGTMALECGETKAKVVEKCSSEKIAATVKVVHRVRKSPSTPSIFFIGGGETEAEETVDQDHDSSTDEEEEEEVVKGKELFTKAETFIGNFYKQLKMQREDSWKRIHGFCQKALN